MDAQAEGEVLSYIMIGGYRLLASIGGGMLVYLLRRNAWMDPLPSVCAED